MLLSYNPSRYRAFRLYVGITSAPQDFSLSPLLDPIDSTEQLPWATIQLSCVQADGVLLSNICSIYQP